MRTPEPPAGSRDRQWHAFTLDHDEDDAARIYQTHYGCPPEYIIEELGVLKLGPIPRARERGTGGTGAPHPAPVR